MAYAVKVLTNNNHDVNVFFQRYQLLRVMKNDRDSDSTSGCSADVSNADSGHGPSDPSEEGDPHNTSNGHVPVPGGQSSQPAGVTGQGKENSAPPLLYTMSNSYPYHANQQCRPAPPLNNIKMQQLGSTQPGTIGSISSSRDNPRNSYLGNDNPRNSYIGSQPGSHRNSFQSFHGDPPPPNPVSRDSQPPPVPERAPKTKPSVPKRTYPQPHNYTVRPPVGLPWSTRNSLNDSTDNVSDDGSSTSGSFVLEGGSDCLKSVDV